MSRNLTFIAFALALLSLCLNLVGRRRRSQAQGSRALFDASMLVSIGIIIGVLPAVLGVTNEAIRIGASLVSIALSVAFLALLATGFRQGN